MEVTASYLCYNLDDLVYKQVLILLEHITKIYQESEVLTIFDELLSFVFIAYTISSCAAQNCVCNSLTGLIPRIILNLDIVSFLFSDT